MINKEEIERIESFKKIQAEKLDIYIRKNRDYGNSFDRSLDEDGLLVAKIRMMDKMNRFARLISNGAQVTDESIRDTLIDLSNYADMTVRWSDEKDIKKNPGGLIHRHDSGSDMTVDSTGKIDGLVDWYKDKDKLQELNNISNTTTNSLADVALGKLRSLNHNLKVEQL